MTRTVLYNDSDIYSTYAPEQQDVSLLDNLSNYDFIVVKLSSYLDIATSVFYYGKFDVPFILDENVIVDIWPYKQRYIHIKFTDTTFNIINSSYYPEQSGYKPRVYRIYGYKFD